MYDMVVVNKSRKKRGRRQLTRPPLDVHVLLYSILRTLLSLVTQSQSSRREPPSSYRQRLEYTAYLNCISTGDWAPKCQIKCRI